MNKNTIRKILHEGLMLPKITLEDKTQKYLDYNVKDILETFNGNAYLICIDVENELGFFIIEENPANQNENDDWETTKVIKSGYSSGSYHMGAMRELCEYLGSAFIPENESGFNIDFATKKRINSAVLDWFLKNKNRYNI